MFVFLEHIANNDNVHHEIQKSNTLSASSRHVNIIDKAKLWHLGMGHILILRLQILFPNLDLKITNDDLSCIVCPQARQTRTMYLKFNSKNFKPLDIDLHMD